MHLPLGPPRTREEVAQQPLEQGHILVQKLWHVHCRGQNTTPLSAHLLLPHTVRAQMFVSLQLLTLDLPSRARAQPLPSQTKQPGLPQPPDCPPTIVDGPQHQHILRCSGEGALQVAGSGQDSRHSPHAKVIVLLAGQLLTAQPVGSKGQSKTRHVRQPAAHTSILVDHTCHHCKIGTYGLLLLPTAGGSNGGLGFKPPVFLVSRAIFIHTARVTCMSGPACVPRPAHPGNRSCTA